MQLYGTLAIPYVLYPSDVSPNLTVTTAGDAQGAGLNKSGSRSERFFISKAPLGYACPLRLTLVFSANPGAFDYEIQEAVNDNLNEYVTLANIGTVISAVVAADGLSYVATVDISTFVANFVLLYVKTQTANSVTLTQAKFSR